MLESSSRFAKLRDDNITYITICFRSFSESCNHMISCIYACHSLTADITKFIHFPKDNIHEHFCSPKYNLHHPYHPGQGNTATENCKRLTTADEKCMAWAERFGAKFAPEKYQLIRFAKLPKTCSPLFNPTAKTPS
ncbi:hypothetical protein GQ43DRAFT_494980 [Delitschia confertaspora ATCC 74209]|uniref:Uncharacterized protein n=1 Tax=Delitschia confertaspora ATCC 74209 TaxID=1513339 RepID=A0A9P4JE52_9PLEO|nr:hypothetical protein GQ43DRAFT_494980 [Delitschia confertaspora ATCC 74209]